MKELIIGDMHFGVKSNSIEWLTKQCALLNTQVTEIIKKGDIQRVVFLGDVFDVRYGFKIDNIKKVFAEERDNYIREMKLAEDYADVRIKEIIERAKEESKMIYTDLMEMDVHKQSVRGSLEKINQMFNINIDFDSEWLKFLGVESIPF
jgi:hypothetical protein